MTLLENYWILEYSKEQIKNSILILHPKVLHRYNITKDQFYDVFESWSNFTQLENPIFDEFGNKYYDSEWLYMAQRFASETVKEIIAFCSQWKWLSKKAAYLHEEEMDKDDNNRINYMRKAIKQKFDNNPKLKQELMNTWDREIIEFTYWWDIFFGIDNQTRQGRNILWRLLVEYKNEDM